MADKTPNPKTASTPNPTNTDPYASYGGSVAAPGVTADPYAAYGGNSATQNTSSTDTQQQSEEQPGVLERAWGGVKQSLENNIVAPVRGAFAPPDPASDAREVVVNAVAGQPGVAAYRLAKNLVDATEAHFKAPKEHFQQATQDLIHAVQEIHAHDWKNAVPSALSTVADIQAMTPAGAGGLADRARELTEGLRPGGDIATPLAKDVTDFATIAALEKAPEAVSKVGEVAEKAGLQKIGGFLRAKSPKDYVYGKDPRQAIIDEKIKPTLNLSDARDQLQGAADSLQKQIAQKMVSSGVKNVDVVPTIQNATDEMLQRIQNTKGFSSPAERQAVINAVKGYRDELLGVFDKDGNLVATAKKSHLDPADVLDLKRDIGKSTRWDQANQNVSPQVRNFVNQYQKSLYGKLKDMIETVAPGTNSLNERLANAVDAIRLLDKQIPTEEMTDIGLRRFGRKLEIGAALGEAASGHPGVAAALAANRAARSVPGRIALGRGGVTIGEALQNLGKNISGDKLSAFAAATNELGSIMFRASDGSVRTTTEDKWEAIQKIDPGAKQVESGGGANPQ